MLSTHIAQTFQESIEGRRIAAHVRGVAAAKARKNWTEIDALYSDRLRPFVKVVYALEAGIISRYEYDDILEFTDILS